MKRTIPKKNYVLLLLICVSSLVLVFVLMNLYKNNQPKKAKNMSFLSEIKQNEIKNYITENREVIIYASSSTNTENVNLEKEIKKYLSEKNIINNFVYLDLSEVDDSFYEEFHLNYIKESSHEEIDLKKEPSLLIIDNGKMLSYINGITNISEFKHFCEENGALD